MVKNFLRATAREAMQEFDALKAKLDRVADEARAEAADLEKDIKALKERYVAELEEAQRAARIADRINELLK